MTEEEHWDLWARDPRASPFQSPAWLGAWWTHLGSGERIDLEAHDDSGRLIGALPAFVWVDRGVRKLVPVGAGQSDYSDALIDPDQRDRARAGLLEAMNEARAGWDQVVLPDLRSDSPLLEPVPADWRAIDEAAETCLVLPLPRSDLLATLSRKQRHKVIEDRHRADRLGDVSTALAAPADVPAALDALFALHAARWRAAGEPGVLDDARLQAFHRAAAPALANVGLLRLAVVRHEARIVAVLLGFADRSRWHGYITGVDMSLSAQSFGTLALAFLLESAVAAGAQEFHFLRGAEAYKHRWGAHPTRTVRRVLVRA